MTSPDGCGSAVPPPAAEYSLPLLLRDRRFAPRWHWTLLALAGIALCASLGRWQLERAEHKRALFAGFAAGDREAIDLPVSFEPVERYRKIRARGAYDPSRQFLLDNMTHGGVAGFQVLTPLVRADGRVLLVNRGFIALRGRRDELPSLPVDAGPRVVTGRADFLPRAAIALVAPPATGWPRLVSFPELDKIRQALRADVYPQVLLLDPAEPEGFVRDWQPPGLPPEQHLGYALQWFGLAATLLVIWLLLGFRRERVAA